MMKKIVSSLLLMIIGMLAMAQQEVRPALEKVTIYPQGALIEKVATVYLQKGENKFVFTNNAVDVQSVHFESSPDWFVSAQSMKREQLPAKVVAQRLLPSAVYTQYAALLDKQNELALKISNNERLLSALHQQLSALSSLKAVQNPVAFDTIALVKQQFEYQRSEVVNVNSTIAKTREAQIELQYQSNQLKKEIGELLRKHTGGSQLSSTQNDIQVTIYSNRNLPNAKLRFSYRTGSSNCSFAYDAMLDENSNHAVFSLKASVQQYSGEHWQGCPIVFSTTETGYAGFDKTLSPYYLHFYQPSPTYAGGVQQAKLMRNAVVLKEVSAADDASVAEEEMVEEVFFAPSMAQQLTLSREYTLSTNQSIPSNEVQLIPLSNDTTAVSFARYATPKIEEKVYYTALLPDWEDLGLLDAPCNVYLNNHYVSNSDIVTAGTGDTLRFSIGQDHNTKVTRKVLKSSPDKSGVLAKEIVETVTVSLTVKNTRNEALTVSLKDQVPISANTEIKVSDVQTAGGSYNEKTGLIRWQVQLEPRQEKVITFSYTVRYPKDKIVQLH